MIRAARPDTVLTFGPDGFTGHPDHRAASAWTVNAVAEVAPTARLLFPAMTPENATDFTDVHIGLDVFFAGGPPIMARPQLAVSLRPRGALLERKVRALEAHHSQTGPVIDALGRRRFAAWVAAEDFIAA